MKTTGETDVAALRADQDTAKIALDMATRERDRHERSVLAIWNVSLRLKTCRRA